MTASSAKKFIAFTHLQNTDDKTALKQIYLPCPRTGKATIYLCDGTQLYELQKVTGAGRKTCWLVENCLYEDGAFYLISPMDPLFVAIPILDKAREQNAESQGKFRTTDDIFCPDDREDDDERDTCPQRLLDLHEFEPQLAHVCDYQDVAPGLRVYRLNDEKTSKWLAKKVDRLVAQFIASPPPELDSSILSLSQDEKQVFFRQEAAYMVAKYLTDTRLMQLLAHLKVDEIQDEVTSTAENTMNDISVFFKRSSDKFDDESENDKKAKKRDVPRSLAKVNTKGMKPLTSFFAKK